MSDPTAPRWDPTVYLRHSDERSRPFLDLLARVSAEPGTVVDLGCGPGHLSAVLRERWAGARIHGVDSSATMIERAERERVPGVTYERADAATWEPPAPVDLLVSNAMFQWLPDPLGAVRRLMGHVAPGGTFALQVPHNHDAPSHVLLRELAGRPPYGEHTARAHRVTVPPIDDWLELFAGPGWSVDAWSTTYLHVLDGEDPVFSWISGTGARPVLQALPSTLRDRFEQEYRVVLREAYPRRPWGTVLPFERIFVVARRPADDMTPVIAGS